MSRDVLNALPDRIETLAGNLSETLASRHGDDAARALAGAGVVPADVAAYLAARNAPPDMALDTYLTHALYNDGLTLVALACLRTGGELVWENLEDLRPLLTRFASFYAALGGRYVSFRTLPRERLGDFWNNYCADASWFGLLCQPTRFQSLRLCAYHDGTRPTPEALPTLLNDVLGPLWQYTAGRVGLAGAEATQIWADVEQAGGRYRGRWQM